ncbi:iron uptake transporter permease EfeU [Chloroflexota bacterium]
MLPSLLLTFREGLEAALIVGIILGYLTRIGQSDRHKTVWAGVAVAVGGSLGMAVLLQALGAQFEGQMEYIFEGIAMLLAVALLTWMIFWMRSQAHNFKRGLEAEVESAVQPRRKWALFGVAFLAVFREGVELALFLTATSFVSDGAATVIGALLGLGFAVLVGWLIYRGTVRLSMRWFFDITTVLLLIFAAGLFAHGVHELQEAGWIPILVEHVYDLKPVLDDKSTVGSMLRVLVGYNDNPSLIEIISYFAYWLILIAVLAWSTRNQNRLDNKRQKIPAASNVG